MKRLLGALAVGAMIFGAVFVSASSLPLVAGTGSIQSSSLATVTCQTVPVSVTYGTELNGQGENQIDRVILHNIQASCVGDQASVQLLQGEPPYSGLGGPGNEVWYSWGTIAAAGDMTLTFGHPGDPSPKPLVADVHHYNVMFSAQ